MEPHDREWEAQLQASLRRVQEAIDQGQKRRSAGPLESLIVASASEALQQAQLKIQRKEERRRRREAARARERAKKEQGSYGQGVLFAVAALVMLFFAFRQPGLWWLVFVAFGFGMASVDLTGKAMRSGRRKAASTAGSPSAASPQATEVVAPSEIERRRARVEAVCDKILAELKDGSPVLREVVSRPEDTLKALRAASQEMARREGELRALLKQEDEERLRGEREALSLRIGAEQDEVVRARLGQALRALDEQLAQRAALMTAAARFEAEGTRILYTLEGLHTQILRARAADSAGADLAGAGLRRSLEQLSEEVAAVAEALETVHQPAREPGSRIEPIDEGPHGGRPGRQRV